MHQILSLSVSLAQLPPSVARLAAHTFVCRFCEDSHRVESVLGMCALPVPMSDHTAVASAAAAAASNDALSSSLDASAAAPVHLLFLVKWHRRSFWHVSWVTESRLRALAPRKCTKFVRDFAPSQVIHSLCEFGIYFFARALSPFSLCDSLTTAPFFLHCCAPFASACFPLCHRITSHHIYYHARSPSHAPRVNFSMSTALFFLHSTPLHTPCHPHPTPTHPPFALHHHPLQVHLDPALVAADASGIVRAWRHVDRIVAHRCASGLLDEVASFASACATELLPNRQQQQQLQTQARVGVRCEGNRSTDNSENIFIMTSMRHILPMYQGKM